MNKTYANHKPSADGLVKIAELQTLFSGVHDTIERLCPKSREQSVALTKLEELAMWAIKGVVCNDPESVKDDCQKTPKPITGWVAWHPDQEYHTVCPSFDAGWHLLERQGRGSNRKLLVCEGWRIRPVELRFTDEGEG